MRTGRALGCLLTRAANGLGNTPGKLPNLQTSDYCYRWAFLGSLAVTRQSNSPSAGHFTRKCVRPAPASQRRDFYSPSGSRTQRSLMATSPSPNARQGGRQGEALRRIIRCYRVATQSCSASGPARTSCSGVRNTVAHPCSNLRSTNYSGADFGALALLISSFMSEPPTCKRFGVSSIVMKGPERFSNVA
jgi:hypothetical protein